MAPPASAATAWSSCRTPTSTSTSTRCPEFLAREQPQLIVLGGALMLFPHRLAEIAAHGIPILYDASHMAGLIAGGRFQDPLDRGRRGR